MKEKENTMRQLPKTEQPYEKCWNLGAQYLSDAELLAVIIRTGSKEEKSIDLARKILGILPQKSIAGLNQVSLEQLCEIRGVGRVKAIQLLCMAEAAKRIVKGQMTFSAFSCQEPKNVAMYFMPEMRCLETEHVRLLILNSKNALTKEIELSKGSFNAAMAAPREIYYYALKHKAVSVILLHNHPSGDPSPSKEDLQLTRRIADTGSIIGIPLLDHIILGDNRYISLKESGYLS